MLYAVAANFKGHAEDIPSAFIKIDDNYTWGEVIWPLVYFKVHGLCYILRLHTINKTIKAADCRFSILRKEKNRWKTGLQGAWLNDEALDLIFALRWSIKQDLINDSRRQNRFLNIVTNWGVLTRSHKGRNSSPSFKYSSFLLQTKPRFILVDIQVITGWKDLGPLVDS